ncbi:MAG: hypothetical protein R3222_00185 [Balneolaceae bacterium]|nr:hypothetical protein [Balneolaceae bacterium]
MISTVSLLFACSSSKPLRDTDRSTQSVDVDYSIIYLIHGDSDYLYHDSLGTARQADLEVLEEAIRIGKEAEHGEVFIFHQRPEREVLWLFPRKDRQLLYYRKGELITETRYSPEGHGSGLYSAETRMLKRYGSSVDGIQNSVLLYFGHEIPYEDGRGYFQSLPDRKMNTKLFSDGVAGLIPEAGRRFDLIVLSTCNNGSPDMVDALTPHSRFLLASPQNLHLSHMDTEELSILESNAEIHAEKLADLISRETYRRMTANLQTVVSLSLYDMQEVSSYVPEINAAYRNYLNSGSAADPGAENVDCTDLSLFNSDSIFSKGVDIRYRPPRFGRQAHQQDHSGWGCKNRIH